MGMQVSCHNHYLFILGPVVRSHCVYRKERSLLQDFTPIVEKTDYLQRHYKSVLFYNTKYQFLRSLNRSYLLYL